MSQHIPRVVYSLPGMDAVTVRRDQPYGDTDGTRTIDVYYPPGAPAGARIPAVVFVTGFSDAGAQKMFGCRLKDLASYVSWAQLTAVSGLVAITYVNEEPAADVHAVFQHVRDNAAELNVDENRIGLWSCSGNVPNALSVLMSDAPGRLTCAVLPYGYLLDDDGSSRVADAARRFGFVNPSAGRTVGDLSPEVPLFLARAGKDQMPGLNEALDRCVGQALTRNLPVTVVNHAQGPHAFDLFDDSEATREIVRRMLGFLQFHLTG
jgi:hypothetical protein